MDRGHTSKQTDKRLTAWLGNLINSVRSSVIIKDKYPSIVEAEAAGRRKWEKASKWSLVLKPL